jgi:aspartyl-tRNA(Asn)/glutamyl-tRNA(Gln) amidotransferase subunit A
MELTDLTITEAASLIQRRQISPVELTGACLERIEQIDPQLNCFITLTAESALQAARRAEDAIQQGGYLGPMHGIPLALKDLFETRGVRTTAGSKIFAGYFPAQDCLVVEKLTAAGAILLGKLNMHEIALGVTNNNPHFGASHNPWDIARMTGGSSGGGASALAARLCLGSLGSDTGGSIRIPASLCGIVGLKPTYGRVSLRGVIPLSWNLDHVGPMARRVGDTALLLGAIAGYDPDDPACVDVPVDDYLADLEGGVRGWRVALASGEYFTKVDDQVQVAVGAAAEVFKQLGGRLAEVDLPEAHQAAQANGLLVTSDGAAFHRERLQAHPEDFGADVLQRLQIGAAYTSSEYSLARRTQVVLRRKLEAFFQDFDILLTPATPLAAPLLSGDNAVERARQLTRFTAPFNLTGLPALSLPCGFTKADPGASQGLPIGLQIIAPHWGEASLLRAAHAYEQATEWHRRTPALGMP